MAKRFIPKYYVKDIFSIRYEVLKKMGIKNLLIDIDNTLMPWGSEVADEASKKLIAELKEMDFKICLISNSSSKRVLKFIDDMDIPHFSRGVKPMKMKFLGALRLLQGELSDTCVIGDQLFTDIYGGNRCGLHTILVDPICSNEFLTTRWIRRLEGRIRIKLSYEGEIMKVE